MKTARELMAFVHEVAPVVVYKVMIMAGAVKVCGSISDVFGTLAKAHGFEAYVVELPGHYVNEIVTLDGVFRVDLSVIQFECADEEDVIPAIRRVVADPFSTIAVTEVAHLSTRAIPARDEDPAARFTPARDFPRWRANYERAVRGDYHPRADAYLLPITEGKPIGWARQGRSSGRRRRRGRR